MKAHELFHPDYAAACAIWDEIEDVCAGSKVVKSRRERYVRKLKNQEKEDYDIFLDGGVFFGATKRTREALVGMLMRKNPKVTVPAAIEPMLGDVTLSGLTMKSLVRQVIQHLSSTGRCATIADWSEHEKRAYISLYSARDVINWYEERIDDRITLTLLTLREAEDRVAGGVVIRKFKYRSFYRDADSGAIMVKVWTEGATAEDDLIEGEPKELKKAGKLLKRIPGTIINADHIGAAIGDSPLADIADINLKHLITSCFLENGRRVCGVPTPYATGIDSDGDPLYLGSSKAWTASNPDATFGFLEFTGQGLDCLVESLSEKERQMATLGARLLFSEKKAAEASETVRLRSISETSALTNTSGNASAGLTNLVQWFVWWNTPGAGEDIASDEVVVLVNDDFVDTPLEPGQLTAVTSAFQLGAISFDTYFFILETGEMYPEGWTKEQEIAAIGQAPVATPPILDPNDPPDDDEPPAPGKKPAAKKVAAKKTAAKKTAAKKTARKVPANA